MVDSFGLFLEQLESSSKACGVYNIKLPEEETRGLVQLARGGNEEARTRLVLAHVGLVIHIAKEYKEKPMAEDFSLGELVDEGFVGLLRAIDDFSLNARNKFLTYAFFCIEGSIRRSIRDKGRLLRIPAREHPKFHRIWAAIHKLEPILGREPFPEEIAQELDGIETEEVREILQKTVFPLSFEELYWRDGGEREEYWEDHLNLPVEEQVWQRIRAEEIDRVLDDLPLREQIVIRHYHGLDGPALLFREIGEIIGLERKSVSHAYYRARKRLWHPRNFRRLKGLL